MRPLRPSLRVTPSRSTRRAAWMLASLLVAAGCGDGGGGGNGRNPDGTPIFDAPVSDNGEVSFTPAAPGAVSGLRVEAVVDGRTLTSVELEMSLPFWDGVTTVDRALGDPAPASSSQASGDIFSRIPDTIPFPILDGDRIVGRLDLDGDAYRPGPQSRSERGRQTFFGALADLAIPAASGSTRKLLDCPPGTRSPGTAYSTVGTFGGFAVWLAATYSYQEFFFSASFAWVLHIAPEGFYISLQAAEGIGIPPAASINIARGLGLFADYGGISAREGIVAASTLEGKSLTFSISEGPISYAITVYQAEGYIIHPGFQIDQGFGFSLPPLFGLPGFLTAALLAANDISITLGASKIATSNAEGPAFVYLGTPLGICGREPGTGRNKDAQDDLTTFLAELQQAASAPATDFGSVMRGALATAVTPALQTLADRSGTPPVEAISAGSNGAALGEFLQNRGDATCRDCPSTSFGGLLYDMVRRVQSAGDDDDALRQAGAASMAQLRTVLPESEAFGTDTSVAQGGVDAAFAIAFENAAELRGDTNRFVDDTVVVLDVVSGEPAPFVITAQEIADLVGLTPDDVQGATLCFQADYSGPRLDDVCTPLEGPRAGGAVTLTDAGQLLFAIVVDLSTATGTIDDTLRDAYVRPAIRLVRTAPGPVAAVTLTAPRTAFSGAPVTLTARLSDAAGNPVAVAATYRFLDADGGVLATVSNDGGVGRHTFVPTPQTPTLSGISATTLLDDQGNEYPGWIVSGTKFASVGTLRLDGQPIETSGYSWGVLSHRQLWVVASPAARLEAAGLTAPVPLGNRLNLEFVLPGGRTSGAKTVTVAAD